MPKNRDKRGGIFKNTAFECALAKTKADVVAKFKENPHYLVKAMYKLSGYQFYNVSEFSLQELCNDADHIADNFKAYIQGFSDNIKDILNNLDIETHIDKMSKGGCLFNTVKAFSELDLSFESFDSIKMGYIFENLIGRFFQFLLVVRLLVKARFAVGCYKKGNIIYDKETKDTELVIKTGAEIPFTRYF